MNRYEEYEEQDMTDEEWMENGRKNIPISLKMLESVVETLNNVKKSSSFDEDKVRNSKIIYCKSLTEMFNLLTWVEETLNWRFNVTSNQINKIGVSFPGNDVVTKIYNYDEILIKEQQNGI